MTWSNRAMSLAPEPLPNDVATLRALLAQACAERDAERAEKAQLASQNDRLRHLIRQLQRLQFGRRSEKLDPDQLNLALEDVEQAIAETEAEQEKTNPALKRARAETRRAGRGSLPEHLPRVEVVIAPEDTACPCCGGAMQVIGEDRSSRLDVIPAQYRVLVTRRPKYACRTCQEGVVQAAAPARLIAGGLPTERLVAQVLVAKYADHCPLYRQSQILARQGVALDRSTLAFWVGYVRKFGFGKATGVDLPGESPGIVLRPKQYSGSSIGNLPIGQGIAVTPIQMAQAYTAIADGGVMHRPYVVAGDQKPGKRVLKTATAKSVAKMLQGVLAAGGTASEAAIPGYTLAGKTGTAQKPDPVNGGYSKFKYVASFIGFAAATNPRLEVAVMVDEPQGAIFGGVVAAPAFQKILSFALPYLKIPPS